MSEKPEISIIIPCFNIEKYIIKCLESVKHQTFTNFEAVIIDDGSTDNSVKLVEGFIEDDNRFTIIKSNHGGVGHIRNIGLEIIHGEYVAFIDGDDLVAPDYLEALYNLCKDNDADISICNFAYYYEENGKILNRKKHLKKGVIKTEDALKFIFRDKIIQSYMWNKLFKRTLFTEHNISFPCICFEDVSTTPQLLFFANKIAATDDALYYYIQRFGSIMNMNKLSMDKVNDLMNALALNSAFFNTCGDEKIKRDSKHLRGWFGMMSRYFAWKNTKGSIFKKIKNVCRVQENLKFMRTLETCSELPHILTVDPNTNSTEFSQIKKI